MGRIITVSKEDLLWYIKWNKLGHDNSIKQNTYLSYYKWNWYWHAFRQRWPQQTIDVDISSWTGGTASFVVTPWMSYTLDTLPQWAQIVNSNNKYLIRFNESTIWEIVATTSSPYFFDSIFLTRWQTPIQIGDTPITLENGDEIDVSYTTDSNNYLCFTANTSDSTIKLNKNGSPQSVTLEISINWWAWRGYTYWETIELNNVWDRVYWRNTSTTDTWFSKSSSNCYKFVICWSVAWSWDINFLLNKNSTTTLSNYCYYNLFSWCSWLTSSPLLTATTLAIYCYNSMFNWCSSLVTAPTLSVTTLKHYCYANMFSWCSSLATAPVLPATTLAQSCYVWMFSWCTALTTTPRLPATTLYSWCYANMFENCSNLTTVSAISATTLSDYCCQAMFKNCTSLTTAPTLSATTMVSWCYQEMFKWCTSLVTAPNLPATTLDDGCYNSMFQGCTSLTTPSRLPATTAASWGYAYMYKWCTSLNKIPALPATTFGSYSYYQMFNWCSNIRMSETQDWTYTNAYRIPTTWTWWETWYSLNDMFWGTWWTFDGTPEINTTYYTSNAIVS